MKHLVLLLITLCTFNHAKAASCNGLGVELQVLGSGGPEVQDKRASSSYLIWQNGEARVLIDSGGGSALRFGESGANMSDIIAILFTHLHADHTSEFPALIKSSYFEDRTNTLLVYGPYGNSIFPSTTEFTNQLLGAKGAYRYLSEFLTEQESSYKIHAINISASRVKTILNRNDIKISTIEVWHGTVPALAWRVEIGGKSITFSGDTNGESSNLTLLAKSTDILVAHNAIPEGSTGVARKLHMPPSVIGKIALDANVKQLVLSHRMMRTLGKEAQTLETIEEDYKGKTMFANDLDCFTP
jgi:ribonuclease BN (tRNA processing enzyme)